MPIWSNKPNGPYLKRRDWERARLVTPYSYSDDYRYYEAGERQYRRLRKFAERLDKNRVAELWNTVVDEKLQLRLRSDFYWFST